MKKTRMQYCEDSIFLALSNILKAVEGESAFGQLDAESQSILKLLANCEKAGQEICITEVTSNPALGSSPVTLLKRIHHLRKQGWVSFENSTLHHRRIRLCLSQRAKREFELLSKQLSPMVSLNKA